MQIHRPKLHFVTRKWPPAVGGIETYAFHLSQSLRHHCDVDVTYLPGNQDGSSPAGLSLINFGIRQFFNLLFKRSSAEITHISDMASWPLAFAAKVRDPSSTIVISSHGTDVSYPRRGGFKGRLYGIYLNLGGALLRDCIVLANSRSTADATAQFGFKNIKIISLATNMERQRSNGSGNQLLFAGRLINLKGCKWFIENVLPKLPQNLTLTVAGTVWDADEEKALKANRVNYIGHLNQDQLARAYADAFCVIIPNIRPKNGMFEGFGLVAAEAAAAGGVVLAAAEGGLVEAVINGKTGFLLVSEAADEWVNKINEIHQWKIDKRNKFIDSASKTARKVYSWERVARETFDAYSQTAKPTLENLEIESERTN